MSKTREIEEWKSLDFMGYPDYEISTFGKVKSLERTIVYKNGRKYTYSEKILKPNKTSKGYLQVDLSKNNKVKRFLVHRIVCLVFLENPNNLPCVNHKDENKENNHIDNLEWVTHKENINYGTRNERASKKLKGRKVSEETKQQISEKMREAMKDKYVGENNPFYGKQHTEETKKKMSEIRKKTIIQYTKDNVFVRDWDSAKSASIELNICASSITACCKGKLKSAYNFIWKYKE